MASSSGNSSSGSPGAHDSGLTGLTEDRKRKRMQSNRESARRSRMRKQKHLDDLMAQVAQLKKENNQVLSSINVTAQHYANVEAENSVLSAQMMELSHRLHSLNEILSYNTMINEATDDYSNNNNNQGYDGNFMNNPWNNLMGLNQQYPIMASAEMFNY